MLASEIIVEVRDVNLARVGQIEPNLVDLKATVRFNAPGEWTLRLPAEHRLASALCEPGAGLIVTGPDDVVLLSGPASTPKTAADVTDPVGMLTLTGFTDDAILWRRLAYPTPTTADVTAQTSAYDVRSGAAEDVMLGFVEANLGASAPAVRQVPGLTLAASLARGATTQKSARFDVLGDLLAEIATVAGLGFRLAQDGSALRFEVYSVGDLSDEVRFDLANGTLASHESSTTPPSLTRAIVAGQGEGEARTFVERTSTEATAAEVAWGAWGRVERFIDQRQTDDPAELLAAGDKVLATEGFTATAVRAVASDDLTMRFLVDWSVGDRVTVVVGDEEASSTVTEATVIASSAGVRVGASIGEVVPADRTAALADRVTSTESRVSALERNTSGASGSGSDGRFPGEIIPAAVSAIPAGWLECDGSAVSRTTYAALFAAIGTAYGAGNGTSTFTLPDLRGRVPVGRHTGQTEFASLGQAGGEREHTLTASEMPAHDHTASTGSSGSHTHTASTGSSGSHYHDLPTQKVLADNTGTSDWSTDTAGNRSLQSGQVTSTDGAHTHSVTVNSNGAHTHSVTVDSAGGGGAHNNLQPYQVVRYLIHV